MIDREKIEYVRNTLNSLKAVALEQHDDMLAYLIQMAEVEAGDVLSGRFERGTAVEAFTPTVQ